MRIQKVDANHYWISTLMCLFWLLLTSIPRPKGFLCESALKTPISDPTGHQSTIFGAKLTRWQLRCSCGRWRSLWQAIVWIYTLYRCVNLGAGLILPSRLHVGPYGGRHVVVWDCGGACGSVLGGLPRGIGCGGAERRPQTCNRTIVLHDFAHFGQGSRARKLDRF